MKIVPFALERYYAKHEFTARYMLSSSDCETLKMAELLAMAGEETQNLWEGLSLGYTEPPGHPLLRESIADLYGGINPEDALVLVPEEGIFLLMHALLEAGDHVICTFPGYQSLYEVARSIGCELSTWEPVEEHGWRFDLGQLLDLMQDNTKLVVANFPHNPTGFIPSKADYQALISMTQERGCTLFSDEMFRYLEVEQGATLPSGCELSEGVISLFGLSKTFGLPGLRMGWLVSKNKKILGRIAELKDYTTICHSAPSEILAIIALQNRNSIIDRQLLRIRRNIGVLERFFSECNCYFQWNKQVGSSMCFPRLLFEKPASEFCAELVEETGIMLVPSSMFQYGDHHVRLGFGRENLPEVVELLAVYLDQH